MPCLVIHYETVKTIKVLLRSSCNWNLCIIRQYLSGRTKSQYEYEGMFVCNSRLKTALDISPTFQHVDTATNVSDSDFCVWTTVKLAMTRVTLCLNRMMILSLSPEITRQGEKLLSMHIILECSWAVSARSSSILCHETPSCPATVGLGNCFSQALHLLSTLRLWVQFETFSQLWELF